MRYLLGKAELSEGEMQGHELPDGTLVLLVRRQGWWAVDDWCNHAGCLLSQGKLKGFLVSCPCHGMEFDVRSGLLASIPKLCDDQRVFPVQIEDGQAWVEIEPAEPAEE
jgi:3-phenylpropionate/trans-cinnamate dioxygenase ferredoxin subunit